MPISVLQAHLQNDNTLRTLLSVYLPRLTLTSQAIKAQLNEGGTAEYLCKRHLSIMWRVAFKRVNFGFSKAASSECCTLQQVVAPASRCILTAMRRSTGAV